jgi:hypothetical protein
MPNDDLTELAAMLGAMPEGNPMVKSARSDASKARLTETAVETEAFRDDENEISNNYMEATPFSSYGQNLAALSVYSSNGVERQRRNILFNQLPLPVYRGEGSSQIDKPVVDDEDFMLRLFTDGMIIPEAFSAALQSATTAKAVVEVFGSFFKWFQSDIKANKSVCRFMLGNIDKMAANMVRVNNTLMSKWLGRGDVLLAQRDLEKLARGFNTPGVVIVNNKTAKLVENGLLVPETILRWAALDDLDIIRVGVSQSATLKETGALSAIIAGRPVAPVGQKLSDMILKFQRYVDTNLPVSARNLLNKADLVKVFGNALTALGIGMDAVESGMEARGAVSLSKLRDDLETKWINASSDLTETEFETAMLSIFSGILDKKSVQKICKSVVIYGGYPVSSLVGKASYTALIYPRLFALYLSVKLLDKSWEEGFTAAKLVGIALTGVTLASVKSKGNAKAKAALVISSVVFDIGRFMIEQHYSKALGTKLVKIIDQGQLKVGRLLEEDRRDGVIDGMNGGSGVLWDSNPFIDSMNIDLKSREYAIDKISTPDYGVDNAYSVYKEEDFKPDWLVVDDTTSY